MLVFLVILLGEQLQFTADHSKLMKTLVDSLYKNKEIFLRELLSNAADALDKYKLTALKKNEEIGNLEIKVVPDKDRGVLEIIDNGIGMSKQELIDNLGTISKSGTADFQAENSKDKDLIGQFGVGFYSSFLVADHVEVISVGSDKKQNVWESDYKKGNGFTVTSGKSNENLERGTRIILHLRESDLHFLEKSSLEELIGKYTQFISFPIKLRVEKEVSKEESEDDAADEVDMESDDSEKEKVDEQGIVEPFEFVQINANKPIWTMSEKDLTFDDYSEFYKKAFKQYEEPLHYIHFKASAGINDFKALLFIPKSAPTNALDPKSRYVSPVKIYVRRVFITDNLPEFLPGYLQFVSGIIDADDFPLNVARETLQASSTLNAVKKRVSSNLIKEFLSLSKNDPELYNKKFWPAFGGSIKLGIIEDKKNQKKLANLLRFRSSWHDREKDEADVIDAGEGEAARPDHSEDETLPNDLSESDKIIVENQIKWEKEAGVVSLASYVRRMRKNQKAIFYMAGESIQAIKRSPYIEQLLARGFEVLYLPDVHDEYLMQQFSEFQSIPIQSAAKEGLELNDESNMEELTEKFSPLTVFLKRHFEKYVDKVVISTRLVSSPGALVASGAGVSGTCFSLRKYGKNFKISIK
eukprot:NODE_41_length_34096_cov_2.002235.p5 type:complete len:640 gc:universal NODE_41_length_34096_cov_2.002235:6603-4684(-)